MAQQCEEQACESLKPMFGSDSDGVARRCLQHKKVWDVDVVSARCEKAGCSTVGPKFGSQEDGIPRFCKKHKEAGHVNVLNQANLPHSNPGSVGG